MALFQGRRSRPSGDINNHRTALLIGVASLILGVGSTAALASAGPTGPWPAQPAPCSPPALPGSVVNVAVSDMGGMMGSGANGGMMGPGMMGSGANGGMMGPVMMGHGMTDAPMGMGMMRLTVSPTSIPAGQVSLLVANDGTLAHEVVVIPLSAGQNPGQRPVGASGEVDESGSLGEAAKTCGAGDGDGIAPGTVGWTTLTLGPGRYELLCNIAGHYSSGMYGELDVG